MYLNELNVCLIAVAAFAVASLDALGAENVVQAGVALSGHFDVDRDHKAEADAALGNFGNFFVFFLVY